MNKEAFICPYCKEETGFRSEQPMRGTQNTWFDEFGKEVDGDMMYTTTYKEKFYCLSCDRGITKAVNKYLGKGEDDE